MIKIIIKEIIIVLLLLLAILLALGVLFYDYIPNNKVFPTVETYTTSASIQNELYVNIVEDEPINVVYELTTNDLNILEKTNDYERGKQNPFSAYSASGTGNTNTSGNDINNTNPQGNSGNGNTNTNNQVTGNKYYNNTGTK